MRKIVTFLLLFVVGTLNAQWDGTCILGPGSTGASEVTAAADTRANGIAPFNALRKNTRSQYLYLASELIDKFATAGNITSLAFNIKEIPNATTSAYVFTDYNIKIGTVSSATLGTSFIPSLVTYKTVSNFSITATGWVEFQLDADFYWNGTDNIIVEVCKTNDTANTGTNSFVVSGSRFPNNDFRMYGVFTNNNSNPTTPNVGCALEQVHASTYNTAATTTSTARRVRPDIKFTFACTGMPSLAGAVEMAVNRSYCYGENILLKVSGGSAASRLSFRWQKSENGVDFEDIDGEVNETMTVVRGLYDVHYRRTTFCGGYGVDSNKIFIKGISKWNGSTWSDGVPGPNESALIDGDYNMTADLKFCSVIVNSGTITVGSGKTLELENELVVGSGAVVFENNASLLQHNGSAVNQGNVTYKRISQPVRRLDFTYWSSPVKDQVLGTFSPGTPSDKIYSWNYINQTWRGESTSVKMTQGKGYIIRAPQSFAATGVGTEFSGSFIGVPNNGEFQLPTSTTGYNLLGNPYPSALSADAFLSNVNNAAALEGTIYLWTHNTAPTSIIGLAGINYTANDYASYNLTGGVGGTPIGYSATSAGNDEEPNGYIAAGQSFFVKGKGGSGFAEFTNEMRSKGNNSQFFRQANSQQNQSNKILEKHRFWLEMSNIQGAFKQLLIGYIEGATDEFDFGYDGDVMGGVGVSFYSLAGNKQLSIQGRALPFEVSDQVSLGFKAELAGQHMISVYKFDGLFDNQNIYLIDNQLGIIHDLKASNYLFTTPVGVFEERFAVVYTNSALNVDNPKDIDSSITVFSNDTNVYVSSKLSSIASISVFDLNGRLINKVDGLDSKQETILLDNVAKQVLIVRVTATDSFTVTKKVIL